MRNLARSLWMFIQKQLFILWLKSPRGLEFLIYRAEQKSKDEECHLQVVPRWCCWWFDSTLSATVPILSLSKMSDLALINLSSEQAVVGDTRNGVLLAMRQWKATTLWTGIAPHSKPRCLLRVGVSVCKNIGFKEIDGNLQNMRVKSATHCSCLSTICRALC